MLDLCAAPGGKSTELAARLRGTGLLVSNDISRSRAQGLLKNLELFGAGNILVTSETPESLLGNFEGFFDKILVDAPCSGEGMFRKDKDMVKSWMEHGPEYYAPIQQEILRTAVKMLRPGGLLLYSTCTFSPLENEENLKKLLRRSRSLRSFRFPRGEWFREGADPGTLRIWPQDIRGEGHFTALLRKKKDKPRSTLKRTRRRYHRSSRGTLGVCLSFSAPGFKPGQAGCAERKHLPSAGGFSRGEGGYGSFVRAFPWRD